MNGYEVAAAFRLDPVWKDTIVVALTGWGSEEDRRLSREAGFDNHLIKVVDFATVSGCCSVFYRRPVGQPSARRTMRLDNAYGHILLLHRLGNS
jgi:CheY-like chemotaxis protein